MISVIRCFYPTASATAYGYRPKFFRAKHSATAKGENCAYGPTMVFCHQFYLPKVIILAQTGLEYSAG